MRRSVVDGEEFACEHYDGVAEGLGMIWAG